MAAFVRNKLMMMMMMMMISKLLYRQTLVVRTHKASYRNGNCMLV